MLKSIRKYPHRRGTKKNWGRGGVEEEDTQEQLQRMK